MRKTYGRIYFEHHFWNVTFVSLQAFRECMPVAEQHGVSLVKIRSADLKPTRRAEVKAQIPCQGADHFDEWMTYGQIGDTLENIRKRQNHDQN